MEVKRLPFLEASFKIMGMRVAIVGGSLSGIVAALQIKALHPETEVVLFDQNDKLAKKIYATGNGHCNLLHKNPSPEAYDHPSFMIEALKETPFEEVEAFWKKWGVPLLYHGELGYPLLYSAPAFVFYLEKLLKQTGVDVHLSSPILDYEVTRFGVQLKGKKENYLADRVVFCLGGASGKNLGSDGSFLPIFQRHGYQTHPFVPCLCPLQTLEATPSLSCLRHEAEISIRLPSATFSERGELLWKKDGLSGIVIFNASFFLAKEKAEKGTEIHVDLFPDYEEKAWEEEWEKASARPFYLDAYLQEPLKRYLTYFGGSPAELAKRSKDLVFHYKAPYGFEDSQVSLGGVCLNEVDSKTLASKKEKGVYFAGECLDIAGICGGYNLFWATLSAMKVAKGIQ